MAIKHVISPRGMVCYVLHMEAGTFFSVKQIREKIEEKFETRVKVDTIYRALDEMLYTTSNLIERTERRGALKLPVKVFSIIKPHEDVRTEENDA